MNTTKFTFDPRGERVARAEKRLAAAYRREPGHGVPIVGPSAPFYAHTQQACFADLAVTLEHAVGWANAMAAADNDTRPFLDTYCTICMVSQAFGCKISYSPDGVAWNEPAVTDIGQVWKLKPMRVEDSPLIQRLFAWVDYAQRRLGTDVPFWTIDLQSPFSVAVEVVESMELLAACHTDPKAVHHLCQMITDVSIELMRKHLAQMEHPGFPGRNFPSISEAIGICIADDTPLIMLSPEMYREFALPYNSQIGAAFGGLHVHSCGNYAHNLDNLMRTTNIRSIQLHAGPGEMALPETGDEDCPINRARRRLTCLVDTTSVAMGERYKTQEQAYADYIIPRLRRGSYTGLILQSCAGGDIREARDADRWTRWTRSRLEGKV